MSAQVGEEGGEEGEERAKGLDGDKFEFRSGLRFILSPPDSQK